MGYPIILYGLADLSNASFEDDAVTPTGWDTSASVNGVHTIDSAVYQTPGDGIASSRSLKQNTAGATAGNKAIARVRVAVSTLPAFVREGAVEVAAIVSLKAARSIGAQNALLRIKQYDNTGTTAPGSGALLAAPSERRFQCAGPEWLLRIAASRLHASAAYLDIELVYDIAIAGYDVNASVWWDRVFCGVLIDMHKGFRTFDMTIDSGYQPNEGNGVAEIVSITTPRTQIDVDVNNLLEDLQDDADAFEQFSRWLGRPEVGFLAIWGDRDKLTNAGRHFGFVYHDPSLKIEYPKGVTRRNYGFRFIAPSETP